MTKKNNTSRKNTLKTEKKQTAVISTSKIIKNINEIIKEYNIPEDTSNIRAILEKIREKLEYYIKIVMQVLQPEEFYSLHECNVFTDSDKKYIFEIYKDMMILHREIVKSEIKNDEKDLIATINYAHSELMRFKPDIINILEKMQYSWKYKENNGRVRYFG